MLGITRMEFEKMLHLGVLWVGFLLIGLYVNEWVKANYGNGPVTLYIGIGLIVALFALTNAKKYHYMRE